MKAFLILMVLLLLGALLIVSWTFLHEKGSKKRIALVLALVLLFSFFSVLLYMMLGGAWQVRTSERLQDAQQLRQQFANVEQVIARLKAHLAKKPDAKGWYLLGRLYLSQGQKEMAKAAFKEALRYEPTNPEYQRQLDDI